MGDVYYKLDKKTREELISTVKRVAIEILEGPQETWITAGAHIHFDAYNSLEDGSSELVVQKK
ncbi:MAG: hypothetical protein IKH86_11215 [Prevotella sp.]|nr:hypothetical protein [Prevotella sp.]